MITINDNIRYIPAAHDPLSADVVFIETPEHMYIFDVGSNEQSAQAIESVKKDKTVVLSHFHQDHIKNIEKITYQNLYVSKQAFKYTHKGTVINETTELDQSSQIRLFLLPSTHAKGCIMLCYKEEYAFLGDALYPAAVKGKTVYNCQLLKQTIDILKDLKPGVDFENEKNLIDDRILDSLDVMNLTVELNDEFDIEITPLDILPENFQSIETIYQLITRLQEDN